MYECCDVSASEYLGYVCVVPYRLQGPKLAGAKAYITVAITHRCIVQMEVSLLDALAVVPLRVGQAKQTLLEKGASSSQQVGRNSGPAARNWPYSFSFQKAKAMFW